MVKAMFMLVICSSHFSIISSLVIKKEQNLPTWNDDQAWWSIYPSTKDPLIWENWKWKGQTSPPEDEESAQKNDNSRIYIAIFLIVFFIIIVTCAYLKYFYCETSISRSSSVSDLLTLYESQGATTPHCYSLTSPPRRVTYERPRVIVNCIPYLPIYSICRSYNVDKPPDYDDVVQGDLFGSEMFPRVERYVHGPPDSMHSVDATIRY